jgi:hypothetical protein
MRTAGSPSTWVRLAWFVALWAGSVATLGIVAFAIRWILK